MEVNSKKIMLQNGLLLGLATILIAVIGYVGGITLGGNTISQVLLSIAGFAVIIAFIIIGIKTFKKANGNFISLGQAIKIGLGIALIGGIIAGIYNIVFVNYIDPNFTNQLLEIQREKMLQVNPNMSQQELDLAIEMSKKFSTPWIQFAIGIIGNLFFGFIIALITGLVVKKQPQQA